MKFPKIYFLTVALLIQYTFLNVGGALTTSRKTRLKRAKYSSLTQKTCKKWE